MQQERINDLNNGWDSVRLLPVGQNASACGRKPQIARKEKKMISKSKKLKRLRKEIEENFALRDIFIFNFNSKKSPAIQEILRGLKK